MAITYTFNKKTVLVDNSNIDFPNTVSMIEWEYVFTDGISTSNSEGKVFLDLTTLDPDTFIPIEDLTDADLEAEVLKVIGGDAFFDMVLPIHTEVLEQKTKEAGLDVYYFTRTEA
jgi:hypothetical protein